MSMKIGNFIVCLLLLLTEVRLARLLKRKSLLVIAGMLVLAGIAAPSWAGNLEAAFRDDGILVLPQVRVGNKRYFVRMVEQPDAAVLTFSLDASSVMEITRPAAAGDDVNVTDEDVLGTWTHPEDGVENFYLTFNEDGSYEIFENFTEEGCIPGLETGRYDWEKSTGLLRVVTLADGNGECGISNTAPFLNKPLRFFVKGDTMQILDPGDKYEAGNFIFIKVSEAE